ncbi:C40 family peptidase [Nocardiopsis sp. MG754419]|uniref:C40 family peptidase n=1 Tax=Nocardiopsis sp. MG754419 TaxID=2259865 RepID=UPI001BABA159|nr:C40 family peptidase [Nocardiopsis sp. MG754419]MBR8742042.1 NlpC/P60 family protein [Nocardiopsis sp. MG754419]
MRLPREHERARACRPTTDPGSQAASVRSGRRGTRAFTVAALAAAVLAAGTAPALAQPHAPADTAERGGPERVHQSLSSSTIDTAIAAAESQKGKPYAWGGTGPDSFDCSGLVQYAFGQAGVSLPRVAQDQVRSGTHVSYADARRGDLLYWTDGGGYAYHVAIYLGGGRMIDAPSSGGAIGERAVTRHNLAGGVRL